MAEITKRRAGELARGVFAVLKGYPEGLAPSDVLSRLEKAVPPTDFERADYPKHPGVRRYEKTVRFCTINAVKAGWLIKERGRWLLTEPGLKAHETFKDPEKFYLESRRLYQQWKAGQASEEEDEGSVRSSWEEARDEAWVETREYVLRMPPYEFQKLVAALLRAMGYAIAWVAPPGPDQGVDIIAYTDPLGTKPPTIRVQVRRRSEKADVSDVRKLGGVLGEEDLGIYVSAGGFTRDAEEEARRPGKNKIRLIDLGNLFDLWVKYYDKLSDEEQALLPLAPVYYLAQQVGG